MSLSLEARRARIFLKVYAIGDDKTRMRSMQMRAFVVSRKRHEHASTCFAVSECHRADGHFAFTRLFPHELADDSIYKRQRRKIARGEFACTRVLVIIIPLGEFTRQTSSSTDDCKCQYGKCIPRKFAREQLRSFSAASRVRSSQLSFLSSRFSSATVTHALSRSCFHEPCEPFVELPVKFGVPVFSEPRIPTS